MLIPKQVCDPICILSVVHTKVFKECRDDRPYTTGSTIFKEFRVVLIALG